MLSDIFYHVEVFDPNIEQLTPDGQKKVKGGWHGLWKSSDHAKANTNALNRSRKNPKFLFRVHKHTRYDSGYLPNYSEFGSTYYSNIRFFRGGEETYHHREMYRRKDSMASREQDRQGMIEMVQLWQKAVPQPTVNIIVEIYDRNKEEWVRWSNTHQYSSQMAIERELKWNAHYHLGQNPKWKRVRILADDTGGTMQFWRGRKQVDHADWMAQKEQWEAEERRQEDYIFTRMGILTGGFQFIDPRIEDAVEDSDTLEDLGALLSSWSGDFGVILKHGNLTAEQREKLEKLNTGVKTLAEQLFA